MRAAPIYTSFNAGELSPLLGGRPDLEKWRAGLELCENFIPRVQGALQRRGGTRYVGAIKDEADRCWLVPFVFSATDAAVLEFGDGYIRFFRNRAQVEIDTPSTWNSAFSYEVGDLVVRSGVNYYCKVAHTNQQPPNATYWHTLTGSIYEIASPYTVADLTSADGSFAVRFTQSGDVVYLTHPSYRTRKLTRLSATRWTLVELETEGGPFADQNTDETIGVYSTGSVTVASSVTLTAGGPIFTADDVGSLFYLKMKDGMSIKPWEVNKLIALNNVRSSDGKYYKVTAVPVGSPRSTGSQQPVHTSGRYWDGDGDDDPQDGDVRYFGCEWEYLHAGYGWLEITGYTSPTVVTAEVLSRLPDEVVGSSNASWRYAKAAWSDSEGWPSTACFFRERLTFARGINIYTSKSGDYENFKAEDHGETTAESAVILSLQSGRGDEVKWIAPIGRALLVGTGGAEIVVREQTTNAAFGPGNVSVDPQTEWGSSGVQPVIVGSAVLHVEKGGRAVREINYSGDVDTFESLDTTLFAEHLFPTSRTVIGMAFARLPHGVVWCVTSDGSLLGFTYLKQQGVAAWHRHAIGGSGYVEAIAVIPSPDGTRDDLWMIVKRTINGQTHRFIEWLTPEYEDGDDEDLIGYTDSHLIYDGGSTSTLSGLDHLEGETVQVLADGAAHPDRVVTAGAISLAQPVTKAVVGLPVTARAKLMPLDDGGAQTGQGKTKRVHRVTARLWASLGGALGPDFSTLEAIGYRTTYDPMDSHPALFTGDKTVEFPGDYDGRATICLRVTGPHPFTLVALMPELNTYE